MKNIFRFSRETGAKFHENFAILLLLCFPSFSLQAANPWTKTDSIFQYVAESTILADWGQTRYIASHPTIFHEEQNHYLGKHPSTATVNRYFIGCLCLDPAIAYVLPQPYRRLFQAGTISIEAQAVAHNYHIGIRFSF